jgi:hypothetical protein
MEDKKILNCMLISILQMDALMKDCKIRLCFTSAGSSQLLTSVISTVVGLNTAYDAEVKLY